MASDIVLLLESEHRRLLTLADQCRRRSRGLADPASELRRLLHAHACGVVRDVLEDQVVARAVVGFEPLTPAEVAAIPEPELADAARDLVEAEAVVVLPALAEGVPLPERRRLGKVYRTRRDARMRAVPRPRRRELSQTELYELARRAGIQHRSRMTQAELVAALDDRGVD
jgi:hypothetical protein